MENGENPFYSDSEGGFASTAIVGRHQLVDLNGGGQRFMRCTTSWLPQVFGLKRICT